MISSNRNKCRSSVKAGFTIVELLIVIVVIGILATFTIIAYGNSRASTKDTSILSDIDSVDGAQTRYGVANGVVGKAYYSGLSGVGDSDLGFTPSSGNVVDVVLGTSDYCIRAYNTQATHNSIANSSTKESSPGACSSLPASAMAVSDSP